MLAGNNSLPACKPPSVSLQVLSRQLFLSGTPQGTRLISVDITTPAKEMFKLEMLHSSRFIPIPAHSKLRTRVHVVQDYQ